MQSTAWACNILLRCQGAFHCRSEPQHHRLKRHVRLALARQPRQMDKSAAGVLEVRRGCQGVHEGVEDVIANKSASSLGYFSGSARAEGRRAHGFDGQIAEIGRWPCWNHSSVDGACTRIVGNPGVIDIDGNALKRHGRTSTSKAKAQHQCGTAQKNLPCKLISGTSKYNGQAYCCNVVSRNRRACQFLRRKPARIGARAFKRIEAGH